MSRRRRPSLLLFEVKLQTETCNFEHGAYKLARPDSCQPISHTFDASTSSLVGDWMKPAIPEVPLHRMIGTWQDTDRLDSSSVELRATTTRLQSVLRTSSGEYPFDSTTMTMYRTVGIVSLRRTGNIGEAVRTMRTHLPCQASGTRTSASKPCLSFAFHGRPHGQPFLSCGRSLD